MGPRRREKEKDSENIWRHHSWNFPNMVKEIVNQVQEAQRVQYRINPRTKRPRHILIKLSKIKYRAPWWSSGSESACQCRRHRFKPWSGKIPHATAELGPWATTTEPAHLEPVLCNRKNSTIVRGPRTMRKSGHNLLQLERALAQKWRPNTTKNK